MGDTSYVKGGGGGPATPASALLDAGNPLKLVYLDGDGVGGTVAFEDATDTGISEIMSTRAGGTPAAGSYLSADGAGGLQLSASSSETVLYASDGTAAAGSESAAVSGEGADATVTLTASPTSRSFGTAGQTAAGWRLDLPAGTLRASVEVQITAASGMTTNGFRYLGLAISNQTNVSTTLVGVSVNDNGGGYSGNLLAGANSGSASATTVSPTFHAADRWLRVVFELDAGPRLRYATGTGSGGGRPGVWAAPAAGVPLPSATTGSIADSDAARLWLYLQSFGSGGATSVTMKITVRVQ